MLEEEKKALDEGAAEPLEYLKDQVLSEDEKKLRDEAYGRLDVWEQDCRIYHEAARQARLVFRLKDPEQDVPGTPEQEKALQLQTLKSTLNNCVADQVDNTPEALMLPQRPEVQSVADEMTRVVEFIVEQNDGETFFRRRAEDFLIAGTAVTQVIWDEDMDRGKGNVAMIRVPLENMIWDPQTGEDIQQARAIMKLSWHPLSWYTEHYPDKAQYIGDEAASHNHVAEPDSFGALIDQQEGRALLMEYWYRRYDARKRRYTINVAYLAGGALLDVYTDVYAHGLYPFQFDVMTPIDGLPVGEGMVAELTPMMRYINRYAHYIDVNLRYSSKARMLVRKNNGIDRNQLADWSTNIIEGDSVTDEDVRWLETKPFTSLASQQMYSFQNDMKQDSGQNQFARGEVTGGITAASAISALQEAGGKITRLRTNALSSGYKNIVEQILWLVAEFYTEERTALVVGENNELIPLTLSAEHLMGKRQKGHLSPPPYVVRIQIQRKNPTRIQAQNDLILQAYSMAAQAQQNFPLSVLFRLLTVDGKEKLLPVLDELDTQREMMQQLQTQNEELTARNADMQTTLDAYSEAMSRDVEDLQNASFTTG